MAIDQSAEKSLFDALYCDEEDDDEEEQQQQWGEIEEESEITLNKNIFNDNNNNYNILSLFPLLLSEQDLFRDDEELQSLFLKERETYCIPKLTETAFLSLSRPRKEAVEWILKINSHYGFSPLTAILAVNYLDRFLFGLCFHQKEKPWMMQLLAVTCLSLAAKVEETHVPLLLDLQVEDAKYVFEAKTIQRMEVLVLSGLKWRMNPVTPLSFLDHIIGRLGFKSYIYLEFLRSCENLLLSVIPDPRFIHYLPSVLATATMLHVIRQVEPCNNSIVYENQLLGVLKISKEEVDDCCELISNYTGNKKNPLKRKFCQVASSPAPGSDNDGSNDSWASMASSPSSSSSSSSSSSCISSSVPHQQPLFKKTGRIQEQQMRLPSLSRVFVDSVGSSTH